MPRRIFLSYRQKDSAGQAGRVTDRLHRDFGEGCSFLDVDSIPLGVNFVKHLTTEVQACDVLLAVIGPQWLDIRDDNNQRRLDDPNDFVRIEIGAALQRDIPVIPILVEGARIPKPDQLPEDIRELALRNGLDIRHSSFHSDMDRLVGTLKSILEARRSPSAQQQATSAEARPTMIVVDSLTINTGGEYGKAQPTTLSAVIKFLHRKWPVIGAWAIVSVASTAIQFGLIVLVVNSFSFLRDNQVLSVLIPLVLVVVGSLLLATPKWLRTRPQLAVAAWIGFFSAMVAMYGVCLVNLDGRKPGNTVILMFVLAHVATSIFLGWLIWGRGKQTGGAQR